MLAVLLPSWVVGSHLPGCDFDLSALHGHLWVRMYFLALIKCLMHCSLNSEVLAAAQTTAVTSADGVFAPDAACLQRCGLAAAPSSAASG